MTESEFDPATSPLLLETLRDAQRLGFFGRGPIERMVQHALQYLVPLAGLDGGARICDLGSGGGLPALVIADARPDLNVTMVDRRQKRTDFLRRAIGRLGLANAEVLNADVADVVVRVSAGSVLRFDGVTARGFGPPSLFLQTASGLLADGGIAVISEPPGRDRWANVDVDGYGLLRSTEVHTIAGLTGFDGGVQTFRRVR